MTINSDKQKFKDMNVFQKLWKTLTDDLHRLTIILLIPVVVYGGFLINPDEIWLVITGSFVVTGVIGLLTDGEMFNNILQKEFFNLSLKYRKVSKKKVQKV